MTEFARCTQPPTCQVTFCPNCAPLLRAQLLRAPDIMATATAELVPGTLLLMDRLPRQQLLRARDREAPRTGALRWSAAP